MPIKQESINRDLYGLLKSHGYKPDLFNSSGKKVSIPEEAEAFQFEFIKDGKKYGKVTATIDGLHRLILYYGEDVNDSPKANSDTSEGLSFTDLRKHLKRFAKTRGLGFELKNEDNLEADMAKRDYTKREEISEGYYPISKTKSYSDNVPSTKIIIQHSKVMQEGEQRFRSIEKIFVENVNGERFLLPTNKPGIARVYARHISEGGTPYDDRGTHITSLVEEYSKMAGFVRATKGKQFNESAQKLINEGINHYSKLRETLHKMAGKKGYREYFDNYSPALMEDETAADLSEMFLQSSLDPRIETVMPILSKLSKSLVETENNEVKELEEWADSIIGDSLELDEQQLDEKCWDTHKQVGMKKKGGKMVPNCVPKEAVAEDSLNELFEPQIDYYQLANGKIIQASYRPLPNLNAVPGTVKISYVNPALKPQGSSFDSTGKIERWDKAPDGVKQAIQKFASNPNQGVPEGHEMCPECGGAMYSEEMINEKKDACYYKVKSRYKVWPSAYASGALVKCRKKGAKNWGSKSESIEETEEVDENLRKWFKEKWVRFGPDGKIRGSCARGDDSEGKPKCLPQSKAHSLGKKGRASAAARKRREDPNPERSGSAINVATKKKSNEGMVEDFGVTKFNDYDSWSDKVDALGAEKHMQNNRTLIVAQTWDGEIVGKFDTKSNQGYVSLSEEQSIAEAKQNFDNGKIMEHEINIIEELNVMFEDWQKVNRKDKTSGMSKKAVKAYRRENPGSKLQTAVTTKPSKLKKGSKSAKRRKSFCARMKGMKKAHASAKTKRNPDSPINKALRRWNCESIEDMRQLIENAQKLIAEKKRNLQMTNVSEAASPAQQAAIAISMKKAGKKPKKEVKEDDIPEGLDSNQKKAGQLGATDKVSTGPILGHPPQSQKGLRGKLVGGESVDPLIRIKGLSGLSK